MANSVSLALTVVSFVPDVESMEDLRERELDTNVSARKLRPKYVTVGEDADTLRATFLVDGASLPPIDDRLIPNMPCRPLKLLADAAEEADLVLLTPLPPPEVVQPVPLPFAKRS